MTQLNHKRALADVVGVEAWQDPFDKAGRGKLYIDVVFGQGRLGRDAADLVRFRLALKRAEIVVVVPPGEPLGIDPASVERDAPVVEGKRTAKKKVRKQAKAEAGIEVGLAPDKLVGKAKLGASAKQAGSVEEVLQATSDLSGMSVVHMKNGDGQHRWIVTPDIEPTLKGRPWDSQRKRLVLQDQRTGGKGRLEPSLRIEVRCLREDLEITDIRLKDEAKWMNLVNKTGQRNRLAAAEALIRNRLFEEGLLHQSADLGDEFLELVLADTVVGG